MHLIGPFAASFFLCLAATLALRPLAIAVKLIDRPGGRKSHVGDVPLVGGLAMLLGILPGLGHLPLSDSMTVSLLTASVILVVVGLIDDRFGLSPWTRLAVQVFAVIVVMMGTDAIVETLGTPFGTEEVRLAGVTSYVFTVFVIVAAINAFNMLDGTDGVAGALALVALAALATLAYDGGLVAAFSASVVILAVVAAFLVSNLPIRLNRDVRCFMGDSGSTLLGFSVAWLCIVVSQSPMPAAQPVTMLWIVALPLYELFWTVIRRAIRGISPFRPDHGHLHHLVLRAGFGARGTFIILVVLAVLLATFGIAIDRLGVAEGWSLASLVVAGGLVIRLLYRAELIWKLVPASLRPASAAVFRPAPSTKRAS